jgi:flagellar protein FlgJ
MMESIANSLPTTLPLSPLTELQASRLENDGQRIEGAAREFESVFLSLLLKEMRNTLDKDDGGLFGAEGSDTFGGMFDMFMGQHLAKAQPLGIANAINTYFENAKTADQPPQDPQNQPTSGVPELPLLPSKAG